MRILRRFIIIFPALVLQILWIIILFVWLKPWATIIEILLSIFALLFVIYLITKKEESNYKILWLICILAVPLFGTILYLLWGNKRTTKPLVKKLNKSSTLPPLEDNTKHLYEKIQRENLRLSQTLMTIQKETGFLLQENTGATYYPLGDDMYPVMLEEIKKAKKFIFIEYFIIENGKMWDTMVEQLTKKVKEGVDVRILYDDLGSVNTYSEKDAKKLRQKGLKCHAFNPLVAIKGTVNYRDHRKMLIIDGKVAFSGGINIADEYINQKTRFGHWKDIGFKLEGKCVENFTRMFVTFWNAFTKEPIPNELIENISFENNSQDGYVLSYYDSPLKNSTVSNDLYIDLLAQAHSYAYFYTPYLMPGDELLNAFIAAAKRGVDVRIIIPGIPDKKVVYRMSRSFYPVLLEAGVKIYEYKPGFVHAKACIVDDIIGTIGTVNLDYRSLFLHFENNSLFYQASILQSLKKDFLETQKNCYERTTSNYKMNFIRWIIDGILRLLAPLC